MSELRITDPGNESKQVSGKPFVVSLQQQAGPELPSQGMISMQFSNSPGGPWTTCRAIGEGGALECDPVTWDRRDERFNVDASQQAEVYVRGAVWPGDPENSEPFFISEDVIHWPPPMEKGVSEI